MIETYEITSYNYYVISSRNTEITAFRLYANDKYLGVVIFTHDDAPLKTASKDSVGFIKLYYRYTDLPGVTDMLRNEKKVYLIYNGGLNSYISTSPDFIIEGEF